MHLRPTLFGVVTALGLGIGLLIGASLGVAYRFPLAGLDRRGVDGRAGRLRALADGAGDGDRAPRHPADHRGRRDDAMAPGPARAPLIAPSIVRTYGLRSAIIFAIMILSVGASTFMLREAATGPVIGGRKGYAGDYGPGD